MEGRTLELVPVGGGTTDLIIGSSRGNRGVRMQKTT
jgi:hypothetical protein